MSLKLDSSCFGRRNGDREWDWEREWGGVAAAFAPTGSEAAYTSNGSRRGGNDSLPCSRCKWSTSLPVGRVPRHRG
jgi:hypothetical protein